MAPPRSNVLGERTRGPSNEVMLMGKAASHSLDRVLRLVILVLIECQQNQSFVVVEIRVVQQRHQEVLEPGRDKVYVRVVYDALGMLERSEGQKMETIRLTCIVHQVRSDEYPTG